VAQVSSDNAREAVPGDGRGGRLRSLAEAITQGHKRQVAQADAGQADRQEAQAQAAVESVIESFNFVDELAITMPVPEPGMDFDFPAWRIRFRQWVDLVGVWQDQVEERLLNLEKMVDALCRIVNH